MLSNAYFLAKFRFDTAENEPAKNLQNFANFPNFADPNPLSLGAHLDGLRLRRRRRLVGVGKLVAFRYLLGLVHNVANIKIEAQKQSRMSKYIKVRKAACGILEL